jgi:hypothetical protein
MLSRSARQNSNLPFAIAPESASDPTEDVPNRIFGHNLTVTA